MLNPTVEITRGSEVEFTIELHDVNGNPISAGAPNLYNFYFAGGKAAAIATIPMNYIAPNFVAKWDSSPADPGVVFWCAKTTTLPEPAAAEGNFKLAANSANPAVPVP